MSISVDTIQEIMRREVKFVYVVTNSWRWDGDEMNLDVLLFNRWADAFKEYCIIVANQKASFDEQFEKDQWEITELVQPEHDHAICDIYCLDCPNDYNSIVKIEKLEVK